MPGTSAQPPAASSVRAAVLSRPGSSLDILEIGLAAPGPYEVTVRLAAAGMCHSDVSVLDQTLPSRTPIVLGHEGAGTVVDAGSAVTDVAVGDRVMLSWLVQCGECFYCRRGLPSQCEPGSRGMGSSTMPDGTTRYSLDGEPVFHMLGLGVFAERCVVPAAAVIAIPDGLGFAQAALIGCGVLTGFGAAVNTADIAIGDSVAVLGCGGVGLNAVQGARISGARQIIAIDPQAERRDLARALGATDLLAGDEDTLALVRERTGGRGVDVAIEAAGRSETIALAVRLTRRGGQTVLVGAAAADVRLSIPAFSGLVMTEKVIRGSMYGSSHVRRDVERIIGLYQAGVIRLDELVSERFDFDEIGAAVDACIGARGARAVVEF